MIEYKNDHTSKRNLADELKKGNAFVWKKSSVRSKEFNNMLHIFAEKENENSYTNYVKCQLCKDLIYRNPKHGNKGVIQHNTKHKSTQLSIKLYSKSSTLPLSEYLFFIIIYLLYLVNTRKF